MSKKLANRTTKEIMTQSEIKEKGLDEGNFTATWQGRIHFLNTKKSMIAHEMGVDKKGEYAIKVR